MGGVMCREFGEGGDHGDSDEDSHEYHSATKIHDSNPYCDPAYLSLYEMNVASSMACLLLQTILLLLLWACSYRIRRDFTRCYIISVAIPITLNTVICLIAIPVYFYAKPSRHHGLGGIASVFSHIIRLLDEVTSQTFAVASCIFVTMAIRTASKREAVDEHTAFNVFLPIPIAMFVLCLVSRLRQVTFLGKIAYWLAMMMVYIAEIALAGLFVLVILSLCCCSSPVPWMDRSDPTVANARHRLSWLVPYTFSAPFISGVYIISYGRRYALYIDIQPLFILLAVFCFLPSYRTALFSCCRKRFVKTQHSEPIPSPTYSQVPASQTNNFFEAPAISVSPAPNAFTAPKPPTIYPNLHHPSMHYPAPVPVSPTHLNPTSLLSQPPPYPAAQHLPPAYHHPTPINATQGYLLVATPATISYHTGYVPSPRIDGNFPTTITTTY